MKRFKNNDHEKITEIMDKFIYPAQFRNDKGLIYHIINFCYPLFKTDMAVKHYINVYAKTKSQTKAANYYNLMEAFDKNKGTVCRLDGFTHLEEVLEPDDYSYYHGYNRRIALKEIKYMAYRITQKIYNSKTGRDVIFNTYFNSDGFKKEYEKNTDGKKYGDRKFTNILKVLKKHKYLFVKKNAKNHNIYMIGKNNPYYQLHEVKNIETKDEIIKTSLEKRLENLLKENAELKLIMEANKDDYLAAKNVREESQKKIEQYKNEYDMAVKLLAEKQQEIVRLGQWQVKEGKWCIYNKPVAKDDAFEEKLDFIISGGHKSYDSADSMLVKTG
ncbi:hypothetical protein ACFL3G_13385 [Planctomycetota bacterium]